MSKDYTKYAKINSDPVEEVVETREEFNNKLASIPEVEPDEIDMAMIAQAEVDEVEPEVPQRKIGRVSNCAKLNVRKAPDSKADVICELFCHTEVEIDEVDSTDDFYKICTPSGVVGFCMKAYITVK